MRIRSLVILSFLVLGLPAVAAAQEELVQCPEYEGITCDGWVTDAAGVLNDYASVEAAVGRVVAAHGHQIAVVIVNDTPGSTADFAYGLGEAWGVGSAERDDGVVVVVNLAERRTEVVWGPGLNDTLFDGAAIASTANSFFGASDFDGGIKAIAGALEQRFADAEATGGSSGTVSTAPVSSSDEGGSGLAGLIIGGVALATVGTGAGVLAHRAQRGLRKRRRAELVDGQLARLEASGHEYPRLADYHLEPTVPSNGLSTADSVAALQRLVDKQPPYDETAFQALWTHDLVDVYAQDRLLEDTEIPFELQVTQERDVLDEGVQASARTALADPKMSDDAFQVELNHLEELVDSLRPYRVAEARHLAAQRIVSWFTDTPIGATIISDLGERFMGAAPVLDHSQRLEQSLDELNVAYTTATNKAGTLEALYERLPDNAARPAVAAALADVGADANTSVARYERVRDALESDGRLAADHLDEAAIAALVLLNNDEHNVTEFLDLYQMNRNQGFPASEAVEFALAGLSRPNEIAWVRDKAEVTGLPISLTAALLRRKTDGFEIYEQLADALTKHDVTGDTRRTIAGILAISLEPAQAERRWLEARQALGDLGLTGSYADIAAAFGASDPRGPRAFALAYAAQRQALARSKIEDADRFAPELAHEGTSRQEDTWTGRPIEPRLGSFDPFTLFYFHWVVTQGTAGSFGWEPVYRDTSWSGDRNSWFGGFGGGGFAGGGGGGSSWGGSSWSSGSFGGFGGGGFSGGGGGGSGW